MPFSGRQSYKTVLPGPMLRLPVDLEVFPILLPSAFHASALVDPKDVPAHC